MSISHHVYDRVYLLGVDGAGNFFTQADTPNLDRIFAGGAISHNVLTSMPTISAQCWGSMLLGVSPRSHRLTNSIVSARELPKDFPFPSVFKITRRAFPDAALSSISHWSPINRGIIEPDLGVRKETGSDEEVGEKVIRTILEDDPKLLFVQFDSVDGAGHHYGYGTEGHLSQITTVDGIIGRIYDAAKQAGRLENTLFLVTADHGGTPQGGHGGPTDAEKIVSFFATGESVQPGTIGEMEVRDIPAIVAFALGLEQPQSWSARLPQGVFVDGVSMPRKEEDFNGGRKKYSDRAHQDTPQGAGKTLGDFVDLTHALCYYKLDGDLKDEITGACAKADGKLYFTEGFYGAAATLDDCAVNGGGVDVGANDFSVCVWIKKPEAENDEKWCVFSNKNDEDARDPGFGFLTHQMELETRIGTGDGTVGFWHPMPLNYQNNWFHFIAVIHRDTSRIAYYFDFEKEIENDAEGMIPAALSLTRDAVHFGNHTALTLDDLIVFDHALSEEEIANMKAYYEQAAG